MFSRASEGGTLQTNNTGVCSQCLDHTGFTPAHSICAFPVYTVQALGCSARNCLRHALGCMFWVSEGGRRVVGTASAWPAHPCPPPWARGPLAFQNHSQWLLVQPGLAWDSTIRERRVRRKHPGSILLGVPPRLAAHCTPALPPAISPTAQVGTLRPRRRRTSAPGQKAPKPRSEPTSTSIAVKALRDNRGDRQPPRVPGLSGSSPAASPAPL